MKVKNSHQKYRTYAYRLLGLVFLLTSLSEQAEAQILQPDSLMQKVEELGSAILDKEQDTSYIKNFSQDLTLKLIGVNKINYFTVKDREQNSSIRYRPDRRLNLGIGVAYKWFALDLAFNVGIAENTGFLNSNLLDFQGTIFNNKQYISAVYQYYYGYQHSDMSGVSSRVFPASKVRDDIRSVFVGLDYTFAFNYDKFSLKAPFIQNEMQKKSAGSVLAGFSFYMFNMVSDSSVISNEIASNFNKNLHLTDVNSTSMAVNIGYMYTLVWKEHFFVTLSLIPSLGLNMGDYKTDFRQPYPTHLFLGLSTINSIGYNADKLFGGIQFATDSYDTRIEKKQKVVSGHGKIKLYFGYRFKYKKTNKNSKGNSR
ncbi:MAG: DUF4421 domain-containing protein [Cyclobacteriaceae bacterium]|nr:DUF4421 domain-containing protein [Cyclobacteriaceae bacterium]